MTSDHVTFDCDMYVGTRKAALSISESTNPLGFTHPTFLRVYPGGGGIVSNSSVGVNALLI